MDHSWLRFADKVTIQSNRSVQECVSALQQLTAQPGSFSGAERSKPFRGRIGPDGGSLRNRIATYTAVNSRVLSFRFVPSESGTELRGQWKFMNRFRIPVMAYLALCVLSELCGLATLIWSMLKLPLGGLLGPIFGFAMLYGWAWVFVLLSRKSEKQLESGVYHAMASEEAAAIVNELLSFGTSRVSR